MGRRLAPLPKIRHRPAVGLLRPLGEAMSHCICPQVGGTGNCPHCLAVEQLYRPRMEPRPQTQGKSKPRLAKKMRKFVFERDDHRCVVCQSREDLTIDHIIPRVRGGSDLLENLQTMCRSHNSSKGARL